MAKITLEYGKIKADGSRNVMLRIVSGHTQRHIPIGVTLDKKEYKIYPDGRIKILNDDKYFTIQDSLSDFTRKMNDVLHRWIGRIFTADELLAEMNRKSGNEIKNMNFFSFADEYLAKTDNKGKKNYITTLNNLQAYNSGLRVLPFSALTLAFLQGYSLSLKDRPRAQSLYLGAIRHIYKQACLLYNTDDETLLSPSLFDRFKVPKQKQKGQRALSLETIKRFMVCDTVNSREELAKDCCILSLCLMGTNSVDLYNVTSYKNGRLIYERTKTKDRRDDSACIEIDVHDRIMPIFRKYLSKAGTGHVFNFAERYSKPEDFNRAINIGLTGISKRLGVEKIQFYQFRHSLASIARNDLHFPKSDIDEMLNHVGDNRIADIYIKKDFSVINEINKKVVDYIFQ